MQKENIFFPKLIANKTSHTHHASRITYHVSRITYHVSRITYHVSRITYHVSRNVIIEN